MSERRRAVLGLRRELRRRACTQARELPGGVVLRCPQLPAVPDLNALHLDEPAPPDLTAGSLDALAQRWLGDLPHHLAVLDDAAAGERISPQLEPLGWVRQRVGVMVLDPAGDGGHPGPALPSAPASAGSGAAHPLSERALAAAQRAAMAEEAPSHLTAAMLDELVEGLARLRAVAATAIGIGVTEAGQTVASACLLLDDVPDVGLVGLIEEVGTLRAHRERGHARSVLGAAIDTARSAGAGLIAVCVDADDWPQLMYSRLGFIDVGGQVVFSRAARPSRPGARRGGV